MQLTGEQFDLLRNSSSVQIFILAFVKWAHSSLYSWAQLSPLLGQYPSEDCTPAHLSEVFPFWLGATWAIHVLCELHLLCPPNRGLGSLFTCMCQSILSYKLRVIRTSLDFSLSSPLLINTLSLNSRWLGFLTLNSYFLNSERSLGCSWSLSSCTMGCKFSPISKLGQLEGLPLISLLLGIAVLCWLLSHVWKTLPHVFCPILSCFKLRRKI